MEIRSSEARTYVDVPMFYKPRHASYSIANPNQVAPELTLELRRFEVEKSDQSGSERQLAKILKLRGFSLGEEAGEQRFSAGGPIAYQIRFASFRFVSGFQILSVADSTDSWFFFKPCLTN